jgi:hypothetical protein
MDVVLNAKQINRSHTCSMTFMLLMKAASQAVMTITCIHTDKSTLPGERETL